MAKLKITIEVDANFTIGNVPTLANLRCPRCQERCSNEATVFPPAGYYEKVYEGFTECLNCGLPFNKEDWIKQGFENSKESGELQAKKFFAQLIRSSASGNPYFYFKPNSVNEVLLEVQDGSTKIN